MPSPSRPVLFAAFAVASALGFVFGIKAEMHERVVAFARFHPDVAALAAVAAGRTAAGDELFAAEGHAAVAAVAGFDSNYGFVDEHRCELRDTWRSNLPQVHF